VHAVLPASADSHYPSLDCIARESTWARISPFKSDAECRPEWTRTTVEQQHNGAARGEHAPSSSKDKNRLDQSVGLKTTCRPLERLKFEPPASGSRYQNWKYQVDPGVSAANCAAASSIASTMVGCVRA
jgi:hypothetical protein